MTMEKIEKAEALQENYTTPDSIYDGKFSKTTQFMVPSIGINIHKPLVFKFFVNAYLSDLQHEHNYIRPIFLLFSVKNLKDEVWKKVYNILVQSPNFITEYDVGIKNGNFLLMIVFKVPEEFEQDYINFKLGRYSQFSEKYKKKFPKYLNEDKKKNIHWQIINKDDDLKREVEKEYSMEEGSLDKTDVKNGIVISEPAREIWDKPNKKREIYRYKEMQQ